MTRRRLVALLAALAALLLLASPVSALSLDQAKRQGLVGEQVDGYVGVVGSGSGEARALVADVNKKRKQKYQQIAKQRGVGVAEVAALAGAKLVKRAGKGEYVRDASGSWVQR